MDEIEIKPLDAERGFTEATVTQVFNTTVQILNSERQAIWARYSAFLITSALFFKVEPSSQSILSPGTNYLLGFWVSVFWLVVHFRGYTHFNKYRARAERFKWTGDKRVERLNPIQNDQSAVDLIKWLSLALILGFLCAFLYLSNNVNPRHAGGVGSEHTIAITDFVSDTIQHNESKNSGS